MGQLMVGGPGDDIADTLRDMAPHVSRLMSELMTKKKYRDFPVMLGLLDLMRRWGFDPDPSGALRIMVGATADGPEIGIEEIVRLRRAFHPNMLDLRRLSITDESLSSIPEDVRSLALVNTPITDGGIATLAKLQSLKRLNLAGTEVTDAGLQELAKLPNLEWLCVNRTQVTTAAVDRLKGTSPHLTVLIGVEP
jgi:hypothetical protein